MVRTRILDLNHATRQNRWVIGTPPEVPKNSAFSSRAIQVNYQRRPGREALKREETHLHTKPIEEFYFVLNGTLDVEVGAKTFAVRRLQVLCVPPGRYHKVVDFSDDSEYLVIRAPISTEKTRKVLNR